MGATYIVTKGNTATFNVQFLDPVTRLPVVVTGGTLTLVYAINKVSQTTVLTLIAATPDDYWAATWDSTPADLGNGTWAVRATGSLTDAASGKLRIVTDP